MSWRKISSQGIGTGDAIFAPFQMQNFFQDGNTGSHEKASQGVGIEKAVFTSSKHDNFIFPLPGRNRKAAECRAARQAERSVHRGLWVPQQAESTAPGIAGNRAFEVLYYGDIACKRLKIIFRTISSLFRKQCQHIYVGYILLVGTASQTL